MNQEAFAGKIVVGVDGSPASIEALKQAQGIAVPLGTQVVAMACWEFPQVYGGYVAAGVEDYEKEARGILEESLSRAFGSAVPENATSRLLGGPARVLLIDASEDADMIVVAGEGMGDLPGYCLDRSVLRAWPTLTALSWLFTPPRRAKTAQTAVLLGSPR